MMRGTKSLIGAAILLAALRALAGAEEEFTTEFDLEECKFSNVGRNAYFSLVPGDQLVLEGQDDGETVVVQITVLNATKWITFPDEDGKKQWVKTRVVEEREWVDDELVEVSRNFFARCWQTNDIYYFGENVDIYENGKIVSHDGAWRAGIGGALPGLIMPGTFLLGSRYYQEVAPDVALDRAEHVAMGLTLDLPAGEFDDCVEIVETTPLDPDAESTKVYCDGIGLVVDDVVELVDYDVDEDDD
jgi:hypothetical protein